MRISARRAAVTLFSGGVIAYPTEGVFGLGCMPDDLASIQRLLAIKQRDPAKGLILIASHPDQLRGWIELGETDLPPIEFDQPTTWIVPPGKHSHPLLQGKHAGLAVRLTSNTTAAAVCNAVGMPIISTSANISGQAVARNSYILRRQFGHLVDYVVPGQCGPATGPSAIRVFATGKTVRAANT